MRIVVHILVLYVIIGLSFVHSTSSQGIARDLSLTSPAISAVLEWCPLVLIVVYAVFARATRKSSAALTWIGGAIGAVVLAFAGTYYPDWLVERRSQKIEISSFVGPNDMFLSPDEIRSFEQRFVTPSHQLSTSGGGPWLIVPRDKYDPAMVGFLREKKAERDGPANGSQPIRAETNRTSSAAGSRR
jgi:hypothetical protein